MSSRAKLNKDMMVLRRELEAVGFVVTASKGPHVKMEHPITRKAYSLSRGGRNHARSLENARSDVRNIVQEYREMLAIGPGERIHIREVPDPLSRIVARAALPVEAEGEEKVVNSNGAAPAATKPPEQMRTPWEKAAWLVYAANPDADPKTELEKAYHSQPLAQLSKRFDLSIGTMMRVLDHYGIPRKHPGKGRHKTENAAAVTFPPTDPPPFMPSASPTEEQAPAEEYAPRTKDDVVLDAIAAMEEWVAVTHKVAERLGDALLAVEHNEKQLAERVVKQLLTRLAGGTSDGD